MPNNSLQLPPPSGQIAAADSPPMPLSYSRRRFIQAVADTREKLKQELQVSGLAGILAAVITASVTGFTWATVLFSVGMFLLVLLGFFLYYFIYKTPTKLDEERRAEIEQLNREHTRAIGELRDEIQAARENDKAEIAKLAAERESLKTNLEKLNEAKVVFEIDEVSTRVFVKVPSEGVVEIVAKIKLRFENKDIHDWNVKKLDVTLHELAAPKARKVMTWVYDEEYRVLGGGGGAKKTFDGLIIAGGHLTPWYECTLSLLGAKGELDSPSQLTNGHYLRVSMHASNQPPMDCMIFVNWERAASEHGTATHFTHGAPAIRGFENRRLGK